MIEVFILRGVSGSGKTTVAESIVKNRKGVVVSADDYFIDDAGNYNFDPTKLGEAHQQCHASFVKALENDDLEVVVVANTNTSPSQFKFYKEFAESAGHRVFVMVVENRHGGENIHGVPCHTLARQRENLVQSLML